MASMHMEASFTSKLVLAGLVLILMTGCSQEAAAPADLSDWASFNPVTALTAETFAQPPAVDWPWVRWNVPETSDIGQLEAELEEMHSVGISGAEIGQGGFPSNEQLAAILTKANDLGIKISLSHGPTQNLDGYSINSDHARKTLVFGNAVVAAGKSFDGALPPPAPPSAGRGGRGGRGRSAPSEPRVATLVAVLAYRCTDTPCPVSGVAELDRSSVVDLTSSVTGGNTEGVLGKSTAGSTQWTAPVEPAGAEWQLISFWSRGVFAQPDPFSEEGHEQLIQSMENAFTPEIAELMKINSGDIFYDSHSSDRGSPDELWTNNMAEEFHRRSSYSLIPNLAALFQNSFSFSDGTAARVRNDLYAIRGDIWIEKHITPLRTWVRNYNYTLRVQPEGELNPVIPINNQVQATAALDRPEHESLFAADEVDNYLPMASANHMTGNTWYSTECCAALSMSYAQTFQDAIIRMHKSYAGGITKLVYHVYPYRDNAQSQWPGFHNFGQAGFSNAWGPREPYWADARAYNDYMARIQQVLTQGGAKTDVAVYMENYLYPAPFRNEGGFRIWRDTKLQEAGYTRDYLDPTMLELPNAVVREGRLAADGPAYKAFIIDSEQEMPTDPVKTSMRLAVAEKVLGFARDGLPVIVVGTPPNQTPGNTPERDADLRALIGELLAEENVHQVEHEADVPAMLQSLGILPAAEPDSPSPMLSVRRRDDATSTDYYFLYNQGVVTPEGEPSNLFEPATGELLEREVSLVGSGQPYLLDAWLGKITPIAEYTSGGERVSVRVRLSRDNAMLIAISEEPDRFEVAAPDAHVTETTADAAVVVDQSAIAIHASKAGTYSTTLSDGTTASSTIGNVPPLITLTNAAWHLAAEDWQPANPYETTLGTAATETRKTPVELELNRLLPWPEIPELQHASGIGTYTTTVNLPFEWSVEHGAVLSLGEVFDSFTLEVNGTEVPMDQLSAEADIGQYLRAGANTIAVRVATTLNNRLEVLDEGVAKRGIVQPYGLVGPVVLTPYIRVALQD